MSKLKEDNVPRLHQRESVLPVSFGNGGATAASANCAVDDVDLLRIEEVDQWFALPPLATGPVTVSVAHGRVSYEEEG